MNPCITIGYVFLLLGYGFLFLAHLAHLLGS